MSLDFIAFIIVSVIMLLSAVGVVKIREIVRAALMLFLVFTSVGVLFLLMDAEFLAIVQILVYAGAVVILVLFAIMLTTRERGRGYLGLRVGAVKPIAAFILVASMAYFFVRTGWSPRGEFYGSTTTVGKTLFSQYILQFELLAILLLAAMIGAIYLVRREVK